VASSQFRVVDHPPMKLPGRQKMGEPSQRTDGREQQRS
jgi:hypothetical protein